MVMRMEEGLDTGPVAMSERIAILPDATAGEVAATLAALGADLMVRALAALSRGVLAFTPQAEEGVTYAKKLDNAETRIDWSRPAAEVHNHIRGLSPFPGAWCDADFGKGPERVKVLRSTLAEGAGAPGAVLDDGLTIACGSGAVRLTRGAARGEERGQRRRSSCAACTRRLSASADDAALQADHRI